MALKRWVVSNDKVDVKVSNGKVSLGRGWNCFLNKSLKILAFSKEFMASLLSINKGEIIGAFYQLTKFLLVDQQVLDEV